MINLYWLFPTLLLTYLVDIICILMTGTAYHSIPYQGEGRSLNDIFSSILFDQDSSQEPPTSS